jgi:hypothetical protein
MPGLPRMDIPGLTAGLNHAGSKGLLGKVSFTNTMIYNMTEIGFQGWVYTQWTYMQCTK